MRPEGLRPVTIKFGKSVGEKGFFYQFANHWDYINNIPTPITVAIVEMEKDGDVVCVSPTWISFDDYIRVPA
jgi:hypothetical protein